MKLHAVVYNVQPLPIDEVDAIVRNQGTSHAQRTTGIHCIANRNPPPILLQYGCQYILESAPAKVVNVTVTCNDLFNPRLNCTARDTSNCGAQFSTDSQVLVNVKSAVLCFHCLHGLHLVAPPFRRWPMRVRCRLMSICPSYRSSPSPPLTQAWPLPS